MNNIASLPAFRWHVVVRYRARTGIIDIDYDIEELEQLASLVERGPDWNCLIDCVVTLNRPLTPDLTVEQAARQ